MKQGYTHIAIVLDRSGSMQSIADDTIGGFNRFLKDQQDAPGEATLTLAQFDTDYEVLENFRPIKDVPVLDGQRFQPRGSTALLDAIGRTLISTGAELGGKSEEERPEKVIFVIITDGMENASKEFRKAQINEMISHQRDAYNWQFVFLGANQDAIAVANDLAIPKNAALTYAADSLGAEAVYASLSHSTLRSRSNVTRSVDFTDADRLKQKR